MSAEATSDDGARLDAAPAQLLAWLCLALVNAALFVATLEPAPLGVMLWHHALDLGNALALGLASVAAVRVWQRFGPARGSVLALFSFAFALDCFVVSPDFLPRANKLPGPSALWMLLLTALAAVGVCASAWLGRRLGKGLFRVVALGLALFVAGANQLFLARNYPGVHFQVEWIAAVLLGACLTGMRFWRIGRRTASVTVTGSLLLAIASIAVPPSNAVLARALGRPGSVLVPYLARFHAYVASRRLRENYLPEKTRPDVPPTEPPLIARPIVVFVTIDCLRADLVQGETHAAQLPALFSLRNRGVWFTQARTPAPATIVALSSIFSGRYFSELYWSPYRDSNEDFPHRDPTPRLPELLGRAGVATATFHAYEWMMPDTGVVGRFGEHVLIQPDPALHMAPAARLADAAIERIRRQDSGPLFVYMHFLEPHAPYDLAGTTGSDFERYLGEVALADRALGRIQQALAEKAPDRGLLVVTGDHGEAFGEHGTRYHGVSLYEELVRVPLLISGGGLSVRRVDTPVSLLDVFPTLLDLFGVTTPGSAEGRSLVPLLRGSTPPLDRPIAMDSGRLQRAMLFPDGQKLIEDRHLGSLELYDLGTDPAERRNLIDRLPDQAASRLELLHAFFGARELRKPGYEIPYRLP